MTDSHLFFLMSRGMLQSALRVWFWLHVTSLIAFLLQRSTHPVFLERYSTNLFGLIVVLVLTLPLVWILPRYIFRRFDHIAVQKPVLWPVGVTVISTVVLGVLWSFPIGSTPAHVLLRLYVSMICGTLAFWGLAYVPVLPRSFSRVLPPVLGVGVCILLLWVATFFPGLRWTDEGYTANLSWTYFHSGFPRLTIYQPVEVRAMSFISWGLGAWLSTFGFSLSTARLYIFTVGLLGFGITFIVAHQHYSSVAAWGGIIAGVFGLSAINTIFRDIEVALVIALALYAAWRAMQGASVWWHGVAGFLVAFSVDGHPVAYRLGVAFGTAYLWEWGLLLRAQRRFVWYKPLGWFALGGVLGVGLYWGWYTVVFPVLDQYREMSPLVFNGIQSAYVLADEIHQALMITPILLLLSVLGAFAAWRRNTAFDRLLVFALIVPPVVLAVFYPRMRPYYLMHTLTLQALLVASFFQAVADAFSLPQRRGAVLSGLLIALVVASGALLFDRVRHKSAQSYDEALEIAAEVRDFVTPDALIVAPDPFYFGLWDYNFREAATPDKLALRHSLTTIEAWEYLSPDAVIVVYGYPIPRLSQSAAAYVQTHGYQRVQVWNTQRLGTVELYLRETIN